MDVHILFKRVTVGRRLGLDQRPLVRSSSAQSARASMTMPSFWSEEPRSKNQLVFYVFLNFLGLLLNFFWKLFGLFLGPLGGPWAPPGVPKLAQGPRGSI